MVKGGSPIAFGVNKIRHMRNKSVFGCSVHAEIDLLNKVGEKARGSKIYLYRFNNTSSPSAREVKNGKPCLLCQHALKKAGVSRAYHVDDNGDLQVVKNREFSSLVGEPVNITKYFLERFGEQHHGKFAIMEFII